MLMRTKIIISIYFWGATIDWQKLDPIFVTYVGETCIYTSKLLTTCPNSIIDTFQPNAKRKEETDEDFILQSQIWFFWSLSWFGF
jgi:hypothetical protein